MAKVMVLGAGGFGISLALMCHRYGHEVTVWSHREEEVIRLREEREQKKLLPGVKIPQEIVFTATLEHAKYSDLIIMAVPSFAVRQTAHRLKEHIGTNSIIVCVAKGLEADTFLDFSTVISQEIPDHPNVVLSGPSHAEEVSRGEATTVTVASKDRAAAHQVQDWLMNPDFRVYVNDDLVGVELGGCTQEHHRCGGWNRRWCWFGRQCKSSPHDQRNHRDRPSGRGNGRTSGNVCRTFRYRRSGGYLYQHAFKKSKIWNSGRSGSAGTTGTRTGGHGGRRIFLY